jgi:hypothetical protein
MGKRVQFSQKGSLYQSGSSTLHVEREGGLLRSKDTLKSRVLVEVNIISIPSRRTEQEKERMHAELS